MSLPNRAPRPSLLAAIGLVAVGLWGWPPGRDRRGEDPGDPGGGRMGPSVSPGALDPGPSPPTAADESKESAHHVVLRGTIAQALHSADPAELDFHLALSDGVRARLAAQGVTDVGRYLRARLKEIGPPESALRARYAADRAVFGQRSYEETREVLVRLERLRMLREELGLPAS